MYGVKLSTFGIFALCLLSYLEQQETSNPIVPIVFCKKKFVETKKIVILKIASTTFFFIFMPEPTSPHCCAPFFIVQGAGLSLRGLHHAWG